MYKTTTVGSLTVKDTTTQTDWKGTLSGTTISNMTLTGGTDQAYSAGDIIEITPTAKWAKDIYDWGIAEHNQDGTHAAITATSVVASGNITAANFVTTGGADTNGWTVGLGAPDTITANGNRSYDIVYNSVNKTTIVSPGMRIRTTRTVAAPTQCTSLNGSTQYYNKTSPAGMTFTDDFVVSAWIKVSSYAAGAIASRYNGTSGWSMTVGSTGQIQLSGFNAGGGNESKILSYQSVPLNKWVHVAAQLDMSTFTATTTTSYIMIDGVDVPAAVSRSGTNPTALVQAGNLEIGSQNGGTAFFPGKIAQVAIYSAKVTQANVRATISQTLSGSETSLVSAYSFNNTINDLNANANNLTAQGSAVATNADSPFGGQADGTISSTLDYAEIVSASFSTNTTLTVRVPDGNTIPTTGGVSAIAYSTQANPYGCPKFSDIIAISQTMADFTTTTINSDVDVLGLTITFTADGKRPITLKSVLPQFSTSSASAQQMYGRILEGSTIIQQKVYTSGGANFRGEAGCEITFIPTSGSHTYKVTGQATSAGTLTVGAGPTYPAQLIARYA